MQFHTYSVKHIIDKLGDMSIKIADKLINRQMLRLRIVNN